MIPRQLFPPVCNAISLILTYHPGATVSAVHLASANFSAAAPEHDDPELKKGLAKSEAAYRRELMVDHAKVDVGVQTTEVDEANLGAIIKANISMGEGAELLQNVIRAGGHFRIVLGYVCALWSINFQTPILTHTHPQVPNPLPA